MERLIFEGRVPFNTPLSEIFGATCLC